MAVTADEVQKAYLAYFGRPADPVGLAYWQGSDAATMKAGFAASAEYASLYSGMNSTQRVNQVYLNVLGREADPTGLVYWAGELTAGRQTVSTLVDSIIHNALGADVTTIANRVTYANAFSAALDTTPEIVGYSGDAAAAAARTAVSTILDTAASLTAAQTALTASVATVVAAGTNASGTGQTFVLTSGTDTFTGGSGNDTFNANPAVVINPATGGQSIVDTVQTVDTLTGGTGTDTLNVTIAQAATNAQPTLSSIEQVNATFKAAGTLDLSAATGTTTVTVTGSTAAGTVKGVAGANLAVASQTQNVTFDGSTATTLNLSATSFGKSTANNTVDIANGTAAKATALNLTVNNAYVTLAETTASAAVTSATIAATGTNKVQFSAADVATITALTTTGAGSVDVSGAAMTAVKTVTAGDGGVTVDATGGVLDTVTSGAGKDAITVVGAGVKTISTGAGDDSVSAVTTGLAATSVVSLGDGNDSVTLAAAPTAGVTLDGGAGTDTLTSTAAIYGTISAFSAANLAKITGFEVLGISDVLANGSTVNLSSISGLTSFNTVGVATGGTATVSNVGANASVTLAGDLVTNNGALAVTLKDATGTSDVLNLTGKHTYTENNDATATNTAVTETVTAANVETINFTSTGKASTAFLGAAGNKADYVTNTLALTDDAIVTLNVSGDQAFAYTSAATQTKLATIDASALTAGTTINASNAAATSAAVTIKGSATVANTLTGGAGNDTVVGGAKADTITGGAGGDTLTGGAGNDTFVYAAGGSSIGTGTFDTITDFSANTFGNGASGAAGTGAGAAASRTGDVLGFTAAGTALAANGFKVYVAASAADATTFLANTASASNTQASAALDASGNNLYLDVSGDGVADFYIHLTGVTTITAAALTLA